MDARYRTDACVKVLIVTTMAPFVWGGAEALADSLVDQLVLAGHRAETLRIPFKWDPPTVIPSQMLLVRALELFNVDRVIALKFPAYLIRHRHKTIWLLHQYRQAYDLIGTGMSNLEGQEQLGIRHVINNADTESLTESRAIFCNSPVTQKRLQIHNNIQSKVLYPPVNFPQEFQSRPSEGYVFAGGRVNEMKRQHLLIEAAARAPKDVRLIIAGPPEGATYGRRLTELVERHSLQGRVVLDLRMLSRAEYADYLTRSAAVAYLPIDEDSLGYVAMEAATAAKPVITATDSGGVLGLVADGETGWVVQASPENLCDALVEACNGEAISRKRGVALRNKLRIMNITWQHTISKLLE